jgi:hypothetical protein
MRKLWNLILLLLAIHFIAIAGAAGWLYQQGRLDRANLMAIKEILFPKPAPPVDATTQPASDATTKPTSKLEDLLARHAGRPVAEQAAFLQRSFDAQTALLDRRQRELDDLQRQVELAKGQILKDRIALNAQAQKLAAREKEENKLAADKGFQDALERYQAMPAKQVKEIFMRLDDTTVVNFLQAMEPRGAAKILKEFKSPAELARAEQIMEQMRQTTPANPNSAASAPPASAANQGANLNSQSASLQPQP